MRRSCHIRSKTTKNRINIRKRIRSSYQNYPTEQPENKHSKCLHPTKNVTTQKAYTRNGCHNPTRTNTRHTPTPTHGIHMRGFQRANWKQQTRPRLRTSTSTIYWLPRVHTGIVATFTLRIIRLLYIKRYLQPCYVHMPYKQREIGNRLHTMYNTILQTETSRTY